MLTASSRLGENARTGEGYPPHRSHRIGTSDPRQRLAFLYFYSSAEDRLLDHSARVKHALRRSVVPNGGRSHVARLVRLIRKKGGQDLDPASRLPCRQGKYLAGTRVSARGF